MNAVGATDLMVRRRRSPGRVHQMIGVGYGDLVTPPEDEAPLTLLEQRFAAGYEDSLQQAYQHFGPLVYRLCCRTVGEGEAADVSQEVWVAAWRGRSGYHRDRGSLAGWLVGIARFKCIDHLRARERAGRARAAAEQAGAEGDLDDSTALTAERLLLAEALRQLDSRPRSVLELAFHSDATHQEIAERTGLPLGTVKSDIRRGLDRLRRYLEGFDAADRP